MSEWAEQQPKDGDTLLTCGHEVGHYHFWKFPGGIDFRRPDGTIGEAEWLCACEACFTLSGGEALRVPVRSDATWRGDAPVIRSPS